MKKNKYGFLLGDELLSVGRVGGDKTYQLLQASSFGVGAPIWTWTTKSPTTLIHMCLKPEDFKGAIPSHPSTKCWKKEAKPVVIITRKDGTSLHIEYRQAFIPMLLPAEGRMVDTATLKGNDSNRTVHIFQSPSELIGPGYCTPMEIGNTYFNMVGGECKVYECVGYQSKDECILIELDDGEVAVGLAEGGPCTKRHTWVGGYPGSDQEYLTQMRGMRDSIVAGMNTPLEDCSDNYYQED